MVQHWDPAKYLQFGHDRARPFHDLLSRVAADRPAYVVDLGCGPGNLTATLAERWPMARVEGLDSSPAMIKAAQESRRPGRMEFFEADLVTWQPRRPVDVLVTNAVLQWVPGHLSLLPRLVEHLTPGGELAVQVPGNFAEPSHVLLRGLASDERFAPHLHDVTYPASHDPRHYLEVLVAAGCDVDAWETTYFHVLSGPDPVLRWMSGTGAGPILQTLPPTLRAEFEREFAARLVEAYPPADHGTVLPFRRVFAVARRQS